MKKIIYIVLIFISCISTKVSAQEIALISHLVTEKGLKPQLTETYITFNIKAQTILIKDNSASKKILYSKASPIELSGGSFLVFFSDDKDIKSVAMGGGKVGTKNYSVIVTFRSDYQAIYSQIIEITD